MVAWKYLACNRIRSNSVTGKVPTLSQGAVRTIAENTTLLVVSEVQNN
ncbi:MAG: hypothetical protein HC942_29155 [Microcoleus sp. SU_5_6]|nr:hypothetical protein [Microcoleus sp. SU_5_6]NJL68457.1 hypothetical protein [Microcoleus sp. SM1_3_4]